MQAQGGKCPLGLQLFFRLVRKQRCNDTNESHNNVTRA